MHHAYSGGGAGWCMFSDLTLALRKLRKASQGSVNKFMIIDTDVHQVPYQAELPCLSHQSLVWNCAPLFSEVLQMLLRIDLDHAA